jgi:hypothetical protein
MNSTLKSMLIAAAAITSVSAFAQDKATLDLLVKKGLITAEERAKTLDEAARARSAAGVNKVFAKEDATKRLTIGGYFQAQYQSFDYSQSGTGVSSVNAPIQNGFLMRRLYLEILADVGNGISGNIVLDTSGNTTSSSTSWLDRAMVTHTSEIGSFDLGYRKVTWGYEESTLTSLFKASSGKLSTVERGITNRYWNEGENGNASRSDGRRLGFGAHHTGLHYNSVPNPQGFEFGASVVNAAQGRFTEGTNTNDLAYYANIAWNNKVSDNEAYSAGVNYGTSRYLAATTTPINMNATIEGYSPFLMAKYFNWTFQGEYMSTKVTNSKDAIANNDDNDRTPTGYNAMVVYKINDNWEGVARYTSLDTDGRGQKISDGERGFAVAAGNAGSVYDKSSAIYLGANYYFNLEALGQQVNGYNAKIQFGFERAEFKDTINTSTYVVTRGAKATVDAIRLQAQVAF